MRLTSVGRIVAHSFPLDPSIPAEVLENARDRGDVTDKLFASYVRGDLRAIPAGTRKDSVELFDKLMRWYDRQNFKRVEVQVLLGYEDHGGVLDFRFDGVPVDLKCTAKIEHSARLQVAGYLDLCRGDKAHVLHCTAKLAEPRLAPITDEDTRDWRVSLEHFRMLKRRSKGKIDND